MTPALRMLLLAALAVASPLAARADERADIETVKACIASSETPSACIGKMSGACQALPEGQTSEGSLACLGTETAAWEAILKERYEAELVASKEIEDGLNAMPDAEWQPVVASLEEAQKAWTAYRDAECQRRYSLFQSGSYRFDSEAACQLTLTAARALDVSASLQ